MPTSSRLLTSSMRWFRPTLPGHLRDGQRVVPAVAVVEAHLHVLLVDPVGEREAEHVPVEGVCLREVGHDEHDVAQAEVVGDEPRERPAGPEGARAAGAGRRRTRAACPRGRSTQASSATPRSRHSPRRALGDVDVGEAQPVEVGRELDLVGEAPPGVEQLVRSPGRMVMRCTASSTRSRTAPSAARAASCAAQHVGAVAPPTPRSEAMPTPTYASSLIIVDPLFTGFWWAPRGLCSACNRRCLDQLAIPARVGLIRLGQSRYGRCFGRPSVPTV